MVRELDNTITEYDMDPASQQFVQSFRKAPEGDPDLDIDGLSESIFARLFRLLTFQRR